MPTNTLSTVVAFALEKLADEPLQRRAHLYRCIADICGDEKSARQLLQLAADLDEIDRKHGQLPLL